LSAPRYVFDAPVQRLRAADRIIRGPEPLLAERTVLYVESARGAGEPRPFGPISVITTSEGEEPVSVGWGTRFTIERVPEADEAYHVSARERLEPESRLTVQTTLTLDLPREEWPSGVLPGPDESLAAGTVIEALVADGALERAPHHGEVIDAYWYVDGHRVETPMEQSAREAADLFAAHIVRLHPSGRDAGETCPRCQRVISWVDHLPPVNAGEPVRCTSSSPRAV
jgi:hypothetical protein